MRYLIAGLLVCSLTPVLAEEVYEYKDAQGNPVFSDQAPAQGAARQVDIGPTNTVRMPTPTEQSAPADTSGQAAPSQPFQTLALNPPSQDEALRANNGDFTLTASVAPALGPDQALQLLMDGQPYGQPTTDTQFQITNADRGEHVLQVQVVSNGQVLQESAPQKIVVQRTHIRR